MISDSHNLFKTEIDFILNHLDVNHLKNEMIREFNKMSKSARTERTNKFLAKYSPYFAQERQMDYSSNIIFLYGVFEQFIESSIREYIENICSLMTSFDQHDDVIQKHYFELWKCFQSKLDWDKFSGITQEDTIKNLYETIYARKENIMFQLFLRNGGNYNHDKVSEAINAVTENEFKGLIFKYDPLKRYFAKSGKIKSNDDIRYERLNFLVKSRNDIAHFGRPANMLGEDEFRDTIHFISSYAEALTLFLNDNFLRKKWEVSSSNKSNTIYIPTAVYPRKNSYAFKSTNVLIFKGQKAIIKQARDKHPQFVELSIIEIHYKQSDGRIIEVNELASVDSSEFSIMFDKAVTKNSEFLFL